LKFFPVFVVGLIPLGVGDPLGSALSDLGTQTGGLYQTSDSTSNKATEAEDATAEAATLFVPEWTAIKSTWSVTFSTDPVPDKSQPTETLTVHDTKNETGTTTLDYPSMGLWSRTTIDVKNDDGSAFQNGATLTADQTVTVGVGGYSGWKGGYHFELYVGCGLVDNDVKRNEVNLTGCTKSKVGLDKSALPWPMAVSLMPQGTNYAVVRLVTTYGGQDYDQTSTIYFTRSGTTWNVAVVMLVGGIAVLLVGAFFIASRGRGQKRRKRAAR
jgi:hypothetical protein